MGKGGLSSSLANAVARREHKERSQPAHRRKYGLLEKKKDYILRARDFHRKEKAIKALRRKAEERNPDEFYFAMEKARTKNGVHSTPTAQANKYSQEELRLMKTQDAKYLELKARVEQEKVAKMKKSLHFIGVAPAAKHTVFVDSAAEAQRFSPAAYFDTPKELVDRAYNRPRKAQLEDPGAVNLQEVSEKVVERLERRKASSYRALAQHAELSQKLSRLAAQTAADKAVMGRGRKRKLSKGELGEGADASTKQFKWKRERKK